MAPLSGDSGAWGFVGIRVLLACGHSFGVLLVIWTQGFGFVLDLCGISGEGKEGGTRNGALIEGDGMLYITPYILRFFRYHIIYMIKHICQQIRSHLIR